MEWIYHGRNRRRCWYEPNYLVCYVQLFFSVLRIWWRERRR
jgi:hypothetical protein